MKPVGRSRSLERNWRLQLTGIGSVYMMFESASKYVEYNFLELQTSAEGRYRSIYPDCRRQDLRIGLSWIATFQISARHYPPLASSEVGVLGRSRIFASRRPAFSPL